MNTRTATMRASALALTVVLLALSTTMAWAAVNDFESRERVPNGVSVAGASLSGMRADKAREAIRQAVAAQLMRPVSVRADGRLYSFDPREAVTIDVDAMTAAALEPRQSASYLERVRSDLTGAPLAREVQPAYAIDDRVIAAWASHVAADVNERAVDASVTVVGNRVRVTAAKEGRRLDTNALIAGLSAAFAPEAVFAEDADARTGRTVTAIVRARKPKITDEDLGKTIVVDVSERRVRLFDGADLEKAYRCAVGTPSFPTPRGRFEIVQKRYMPTWINPAPNGWGADMPAMIPPGPSNPLGTRALNISAPGIRFHGTTKIGSIGTAASHGCMRMVRSDIEDLYERVDVGTPVFIVE